MGAMKQEFDPKLRGFRILDTSGMVRELLHIQNPFAVQAATPQSLSTIYLQKMSPRFAIKPEEIKNLNLPPDDRVTKSGSEYRFVEEKQVMDISTLAYVQTYAGIPVWRAGMTVQTKRKPLGVLSSQFTGFPKIKVKIPSREKIKKMEKLGPKEVAGLFKIATNVRSATASLPVVKFTRLWIYQFDAKARTPHLSHPFNDTEEGENLYILPLPELPDSVKDGAFYLVKEIVFSYGLPFKQNINWRALVDVATGAVLYLRALVDNVDGMVFGTDPISQTGNAANGPTANNATLNPLRQSVTLQGLDAPAGGVQSLVGDFVQISDFELATVAPPTRPAGLNFNYNVRTDNFAAVNAYHHCDAFFRLVEDLGFTISSYFGGTTFPVPVDHRGRFLSADGIEVNASCSGNGAGGIANVDFELADLTDLTDPVGLACDWRVVLHELGGHGILYDHVNDANFDFAHSAGDTFAAILNDLGNQAPDRFVTFPWLNFRRHDRDVTAGWAWGGTSDTGGYNSEQIISTTLFRFYRSIGGDSTDINLQRFASRYAAYLLLRAVGTLTPATNPDNPLSFANALLTADQGDWTSEGHAGGAYGKVMRWAFEKQGLYQPAGAPTPVTGEGDPPAVDVYINDGRNGEYPFAWNFWVTTEIWNLTAPNPSTVPTDHETPILDVTNYLYVRVKNRGTQPANNVVVNTYHCRPGTGLVWPDDWQETVTASLPASGSIPVGGETIVGPFDWVPTVEGHECLLAIVECPEDVSNVNNFTAGDSIPHWRLVPNDNNIAQRNVAPQPGGGGLKVLAEALRQKQFWVSNPFNTLGAVELHAELPQILVKKGWKIRLLNPGGEYFTLAPRTAKHITFTLVPGADFLPAELQGGQDFTISTRINGILVGGMTYHIDPQITQVPRERLDAEKPDFKKKCSRAAHKLLDCLDIDLPVGKVKRACIKKITVDIELDDDCC